MAGWPNLGFLAVRGVARKQSPRSSQPLLPYRAAPSSTKLDRNRPAAARIRFRSIRLQSSPDVLRQGRKGLIPLAFRRFSEIDLGMRPGNLDSFLVESVLNPLAQFAGQTPLFSRFGVATDADVNAMVAEITHSHRCRSRNQPQAD